MNKNPLELLREKLPELTNMQKKIGDYILQHSSETAFLTIEQLAKKVGTSTTTIMRLTAKLGYSGYSEMQDGLQELIRGQHAPHNRLEINLKEINKDDLWLSTVNHNINQIQNTIDSVTIEILDKVLELIIGAERIFCVSVRSGLPVGQYLTHGLNRSLGNCNLISADDLVDKVIDITSKDIIIAVSFPRYINKVIDMVSIAKEESNVKVISITDNFYAPIVNYSDVVIPCDSSSLAFHNSPIAAMFVVDYIISAVAIENADVTKKRLNKVNKYMTKFNYHYK